MLLLLYFDRKNTIPFLFQNENQDFAIFVCLLKWCIIAQKSMEATGKMKINCPTFVQSK